MENGLRRYQSASRTLGTNHIYNRNESDPIERCAVVACAKLFLLLHHRGQKCLYVTSSNVVSSIDLLSFDLWILYEIKLVLSIYWRYPFDWRTPSGYLAAVFIQYIIAVYGFAFFGAMLSFGLGTYLFTVTLIDDAKEVLQNVDDCAKFKRKQTRMLKQLYNFIRFHSDMKQLNHKHFNSFEIFIRVPF